MRASNLRGRGRRGISDGMKWGFVAAQLAQTEVRGGERRRERAGHLQGPAADGERSAQLLEGMLIAAAGRGRARGYIYVRANTAT